MPTDDYHPYWREFSKIDFYPISIGAITVFVILLLLLICSALVSGSEVAFFLFLPVIRRKLRIKNKIVPLEGFYIYLPDQKNY